MKKNVDITIDIKTARRMLGVAGIVTNELTDEKVFEKVLDWITIYDVTYSINQDLCQMECVSKTLEQTIKIPKKEMEYINKLLTMTGDEIYQKYGRKRDEAIVHTAQFPDNIEVDIKLVICEGDDTPFTEAVLFQNGHECTITPVEFEYGGEWDLEYNGNEYIVNVIAED